MAESYKEKLANVTTFIFDVDGVLTDGSVLLFRDEYVREMNSRDSYAIQYAIKKGFQVYIITGGNSERLKERLMALGVTDFRLQSKNKLSVYNDLKLEHGFEDDEILYMGDDIPDYQILERVGVSTCPQDAAIEIRSICMYTSPYSGGKHCVRDVIEQTMRAQTLWFQDDAFNW